MHTLNSKLFKLVRNETNEDYDVYNYTCDINISCETGIVNVSELSVIVNKGEYKWIQVNAVHNAEYVYGDTEFEDAISNLTGLDVQFTESGMQEEGYASMEAFDD